MNYCGDADCEGENCPCRQRNTEHDIEELLEGLFWIYDAKRQSRKGEERLMFKQTIRPYIKRLSQWELIHGEAKGDE